ncbi:MAG: aminoacyl-tRNA hydrolase [Parcubacteria group bacterium]|nr:aminoacyl-tRNA hydrolase [Parcubacteria group bacterium]
MEQLPKIVIPEEELIYEYFRSSGPGGQNVNKVTTGVRIRFNIEQSKVFAPEQKQKIRDALRNKINENDELLIENEETRSQSQNKNNAYERLIELITEALEEEKERIPTKVPESSKRKRIEEKKKIGEKKKLRQIKPEDFE